MTKLEPSSIISENTFKRRREPKSSSPELKRPWERAKRYSLPRNLKTASLFA
jgi:hypothetical protein